MVCGQCSSRVFAWSAVAVLAAAALGWSGEARAAGHRTANFLVDAPTEQLARRIGDAAEQYRAAVRDTVERFGLASVMAEVHAGSPPSIVLEPASTHRAPG
jgi:hypothetical protein